MNARIKELASSAMLESIEVRDRWGREHDGPLDVYALCKDMGVKVRFVEIASMEGLYGRREDGASVIWLSSLRPLPRRNFSCAHELGHHVFCHGSTVDELVEGTREKSKEFSPEEFLVNTFASFLLMPTLGVRKAFASRGWNTRTATPLQVYTAACHFGVGYDTLVGHLEYALDTISPSHAAQLRRVGPKDIRSEILGCPSSAPLVIVDRHWGIPTVDAEVGSLLLFPKGATADGSVITTEAELQDGRLFRAVHPGVVRVTCPGTPWAVFARVSRFHFAGFAEYRHLENEDDDE